MISYTVLISTLRKKMRQNEIAFISALISFLLFYRLCPKTAPEHIIIGQSSPRTHYFYYFFVGNIALDLQMPQNPTIFYYFFRKIMPRTTLYLVETAPDPTIFYFSGQKFLPWTALDLVKGIITLLDYMADSWSVFLKN